MKYILGIDIGTTNTKAVAYNFDGVAIGQSNRSYPFISRKEGYHELDPQVLLEAVTHVMKTVLELTSDGELAGIGFSSAMHGLIAVDKKGYPITNMITWADLRSTEHAKRTKYSDLGHKLYERTGTPVHPMSPFCKLMWLKDNEPEIFSSAHKFISIKEYVFFHLFGEYVVDHSVASSTGLFDIYDLDWNSQALTAAGINPAKLSQPVRTTHVMKGLSVSYAAILGIDRQTPFVIGASDGCLAHIGSNALDEGDVSLTIGTSGAVRMMIAKPVFDVAQRIFNYVLTDGHYLSGGALNNGGNVLQWFAKGFFNREFSSTEQFEDLIAQACAVPAGSDGLVFLPYIYGERAPVWDAEARGIFFGVSSVHTSAHFLRAIMEGISFALYEILDIMEETIAPVKNIYASGGFIKSQNWIRLLTDVIGKKILVTHAEDSSAAGAAMIAMVALGIKSDIHEMRSFFSVKETYEPDMRLHDVYMRNYAVYSNLYSKFRDLKYS